MGSSFPFFLNFLFLGNGYSLLLPLFFSLGNAQLGWMDGWMMNEWLDGWSSRVGIGGRMIGGFLLMIPMI